MIWFTRHGHSSWLCGVLVLTVAALSDDKIPAVIIEHLQ